MGFVGWWVFGWGSTFSFGGLDVLEMIVSEIRRIFFSGSGLGSAGRWLNMK